MSTIAADAPPAPEPANQIITLTSLFWAFSYVLLSIRGALFNDDWSNLFDNNRLLAVSVGAGAYVLILRQLTMGEKISLKRALGWIAGATVAVLIVRFTVDELMFDVPQGPAVNLLWSLTWSAYFGLWVMGALAFVPTRSPAPTAAVTPIARPDAAAALPGDRADIDNFEWLVTAIIDEAVELRSADRARLAERVVAIGGYESADALAADNQRARLAMRIAARLSAVR